MRSLSRSWRMAVVAAVAAVVARTTAVDQQAKTATSAQMSHVAASPTANGIMEMVRVVVGVQMVYTAAKLLMAVFAISAFTAVLVARTVSAITGKCISKGRENASGTASGDAVSLNNHSC